MAKSRIKAIIRYKVRHRMSSNGLLIPTNSNRKGKIVELDLQVWKLYRPVVKLVDLPDGNEYIPIKCEELEVQD